MELKHRIIDLRLEGKTYDEIVKELNCAKSTVSFHLSLIDKIIELRKDFITYEEINKKYNIGEDRLKRICLVENLSKIKSKNQIKVNNELIIEMQKYYDEVKSKRKTAEKFNLSTATISKYINLQPPRVGVSETERKKQVSKAVVSWRKRVKIELVNYKGGKCEKCGYDKCVEALCFHHKDPNEKDFGIGGRSYSFEKLKLEVDKCDLLCSNCHIELHTELKEKN